MKSKQFQFHQSYQFRKRKLKQTSWMKKVAGALSLLLCTYYYCTVTSDEFWQDLILVEIISTSTTSGGSEIKDHAVIQEKYNKTMSSRIIKETTTHSHTSTNNSKTNESFKIDNALLVARALGKTTEDRTAAILSRKEKTKLSIVISHCDKPVDWMASYIGKENVQVMDITVMSKCGKDVEGVQRLEQFFGLRAVIKRLSNVGRCDHGYAHHVHEIYSRTEQEFKTLNEDEEASEKSLVLFIKDNNYHLDTYVPFSDVFATASDVGFGCVQDVGYDLYLDCTSGPECTEWPYYAMKDAGILLPQAPYNVSYLGTSLHYKPMLEKFGLREYSRLERDDNSNFLSKDYSSLGEWAKALGLVFPDSEYVNVCYGGNFLFQKRGILTQSADAWANMEKSLSRGNNIQEGHFAERSWASLVAPPPRDLPLKVLGEKLKPSVAWWRDNIMGDHGRMYMTKKSPLLKGPIQQALMKRKSVDKPRIPVFYNVFSPSSDDVPFVKSIVEEQMGMSLPRHEFWVRSIGSSFEIPNTKLLRQTNDGDEVETLELIWQHCNEFPSDKVVYIHSKGSFHYNEDNNRLRRFLTRGALSEECADLPDTCNVCSTRMSPMPHPHTSGNMWLARCEYVKRLPQPSKFEELMSQHAEKMHILTEDCHSCFGLGRFSAEHWIHSHPSVKPCDLYSNKDFVADYEKTPEADYEMNLELAPRFEIDIYGGPPPCMFGQYQHYRLSEYRGLYGEDVVIPDDWYGWKLLKKDPSPLRIPAADDAICRLKDPEVIISQKIPSFYHK